MEQYTSVRENHPSNTVRATVARWYFGVIAAVLLVTIIAQCILTYSEGRSLANTFSFFTIQSNVLVCVSSALLAIYGGKLRGVWWRLLRLSALVGITVTLIVYVFFLAKYIHLTGLAMLYNQIFHHIIPIATIIGFIIFEPRQGFRWKDYLFMAWPIGWLVYTMIRGAYFNPEFTGFTPVPSEYPYPFLDVTRVPMSEVVGSIIFISILLLLVGAVYIYSDSRKPFRWVRIRSNK